MPGAVVPLRIPDDGATPPKAVVSALFGYDWFISYARRDGSVYASQLCEQLTSHDFRSFLDSSDFSPGEQLPLATRRAIRRSTVVILVASPAAVVSPHVIREVQNAKRLGKKIVPISIGGVLQREALDEVLRQYLENLLWIDEEDTALVEGPSARVTGELLRTFTFVRRSRWQQRILAAAALLFLVLFVATSVETWRERSATRLEREQRERAQRGEEEARRQTDIANKEKRFAEEQKRIAEEQTLLAEAKTKEANVERDRKAAALQRADAEARRAEREATAAETARLFSEIEPLIDRDPIDAARRLRDAFATEDVARAEAMARLWFGRRTERILPGADGASALAWSPDGRHLATLSSSHAIRIWHSGVAEDERDRWQPVSDELVMPFRVQHLEFAPLDPVIAAAGDDGEVAVIRWSPVRVEWHQVPFMGGVQAIAWQPGGHALFVTGDHCRVNRLDALDKGAPRWPLPAADHKAEDSAVIAIAASSDGSALGVLRNDRLDVVNAVTGNSVNSLSLPGNPNASSLVWASDDSLLFGGNDGTIYGWSPRTSKFGAVVAGATTSMSSLALGEGRIAAAYRDGHIHFFDLAKGGKQSANSLDAGTVPLKLAWMPGPERVLAWSSAAPGIHIERPYRADYETHLRSLDTADPVRGFALSRDGRRQALGYASGKIRVVMDGGTYIECEENLKSPVIQLVWSSDDRTFAAGTLAGIVRTYKVDGSCQSSSRAYDAGNPIRSLSFRPRSAELAVSLAGGGVVRLSTPKMNHLKIGHPSTDLPWNDFLLAAWMPDGQRMLAYSANANALFTWFPDKPASTHTVLLPESKNHPVVQAIQFASSVRGPDRTAALTTSDGRVIFFDADFGILRQTRVGRTPITGVSWSPSGQLLALCEDQFVFVVDSQGRVRARYRTIQARPSGVGWLSDGSAVLVAGWAPGADVLAFQHPSLDSIKAAIGDHIRWYEQVIRPRKEVRLGGGLTW